MIIVSLLQLLAQWAPAAVLVSTLGGSVVALVALFFDMSRRRGLPLDGAPR